MCIKLPFKKIFSIFLICVTLLFLGLPANAAPTVVFTVVNDQFQALSDATMPVEKDGKYYVPYTVFLSGFGDLKAYNSTQEQVLVLYDKEKVISFDIAHGYTYDQQMRTYNESAFTQNGRVFVPVSFICSTWGFYYSIIPSSKGNIVRINKEAPSLSDSMLLYLGDSVMSSLISQYDKATPPSGGVTTPPISNEPPPVETRKTVYLTFDASPGGATTDILKALSQYRYSATFFCGLANMDADDVVRNIIINGHTVGLNADLLTEDLKENTPDAVTKQLSEANARLLKIAKTKSRVVRITDAGLSGLSEEVRDALYLSGYRLWDYTIDATAKSTSYSISTLITSALKKTSRPAVIMLGNREADLRALNSVLAFLKENNYIVLPVNDWDTPINAYQDIR